MLRSDRTLMCPARFFCLKQDGQDGQDLQDDSPSLPKTIGTRVAITIKVLTDLFSVLRRCSIDIKVFQTFAPCEKNEIARRAAAARRQKQPNPGPIGPECL